MNKRGGVLGIVMIIIGIVALYFIFKMGLVREFINFIKGFF